MKRTTVATSISLDPDVLEKARERVEDNGQSLSSYVNLLMRRDLGIVKPKARRGLVKAST